MPTLKEIIGANIKAQRKRLGISQDELGERVDLSVTSIGLIERGVTWPDYGNLVAIANALGCDERALIATDPVPVVSQGIPRDLLAKLADADESKLRRIAGVLNPSDELLDEARERAQELLGTKRLRKEK